MVRKRRTKTVVVVEDEADVRKFACRVLDLEGYTVLEAADGDVAMALVTEHQPALVLLDLRLPGRDGWSVLQEIKSKPELSPIAVIVFSASAGAPHRRKALNMGAVEYLVKPLSAAVLREAVARVLRPGM